LDKNNLWCKQQKSRNKQTIKKIDSFSSLSNLLSFRMKMLYLMHPFFQLLQKIFSGIRFHGLPFSHFLTSPTASQATIALSCKFAYFDARTIVPFHLNSLKKKFRENSMPVQLLIQAFAIG